MKKRKLKPKFVKCGQRILCSLCAFLLVIGGAIGSFSIKANAAPSKGEKDFFEDFENETISSLISQGWSIYDADGDGYNWIDDDSNYNLFTCIDDNCLTSASYINYTGVLYPDNYIYSPALNISSTSKLSFWVCAQDSSDVAEHFSVYIGTGKKLSEMTELYSLTLDSSYSRHFKNITLDLSSFANSTCYIMIRHYDSSDNYWLNIDNFCVSDYIQTITASDITLELGETGKITASTDGDGDLSYAATSGDDVISVDANGTITPLKVGTATVTITASETTNYYDATKEITVTVNKANPTITASDLELTYGQSGTITASTDGDGDFSYMVTAGDDVISVAADGTITPLKAGTATVTITAAETSNYCEATKNITVTVNKADQTITASDLELTYGQSGTITASATDTDSNISYEITSGTDVISFDSPGSITTLKAGDAVVTIKASETDKYNECSKTIKVKVNKADQDITVNNVPVKIGNTAKINVTRNAGNGDIEYAVTSGDDYISVDSDGNITTKALGEAHVRVTAKETDNYNSTYVNITVTVIDKNVQAIDASDIEIINGTTGKSIDAKLTMGDGTLSYAVTGGDAITVDSTTGAITTVKEGTAKVTITASETADYAKLEKTVSITVKEKEPEPTSNPKPTSTPEPESAPEVTVVKDWLDPIRTELAIGVEAIEETGTAKTVYYEGDFSLPYEIMKTLQDNPLLTLVYTFPFEGEIVTVTIPGNMVVANPEIPWYGPAYLVSNFSSGKVYGNNTGVYIVKKGDTLTAIANVFGTTVQALVDKNKIKNPDLIYEGQEIKY